MFHNAYRGKRVLVTGHTGFKGAWLSHWLLDLGATVGGFSIDVPTQPSVFEALDLAKRTKHQFGDIRDLSSLEKYFREFKPEIVFHLAAQALVRPSYDDPKGTFDTNVGGTVNVLEAVRKAGTVEAAIAVTSDKCYENDERDSGYRETDPLGGKDPYSASKGAAEIVYSAYARSFLKPAGIRSASARAGNVIGGGDWAIDRLIPDCLRAWERGEEVVIRYPKSTRPWQHVLEPLSGYLWLGAELFRQPSLTDGESFNFGPPEGANHTVEEVLIELKKFWTKGRWRHDAQASQGKPEAKLLQLNIEKAHRDLKWNSILSFQDSLRMTAEWYVKNAERSADLKKFTSVQISNYFSSAQSSEISWTN